MGSVVLQGATSGATTITPTDAVTVTVTLPSTGGTLQTSGSGYTTNGVAYATSTSALATGSALTFNGTNLGVGTSSPQGKLQVGSPNSSGSITIPNCTIDAQSIISSNLNSPVLSLNAYSTGYGMDLWVGTTGLSPGYIDIRQNESLIFRKNTSSGTAIETMRINASGYLGIGTSSPSQPLDVNGTIQSSGGGLTFQAYQSSNSQYAVFGIYDSNTIQINSYVGTTPKAIRFAGYTTEYARIDTSGNLLVGTTSFAPTSNQGISLQPPQNGGYGITVTSSVSTVSSGGLQMYSTGAGAYRFYVDFSGTIHATNTSITAISDQSLKTNIKPLETGLTQILALQPRRFDWTEESKNEAKNVAGFIAQEVEQVLPDLVAPFRYNDTETKLGLKMGDMIPTIVKAIQELNTLVTTQSAEIAALKAKVGV